MTKGGQHKNSLSVSKGVEQPSSVNHDSVKSFKRRRRSKLKPEKFLDGIIKGNITVLSQAITLVESSLHNHQDIATELVEKCLPYSGNSLRIGITGVPGVGKSSFIESFGKILTGRGSKLAVLAVDPSSGINRGSILGDKTRMEELSTDPSAFIRPSPSGGSLGGVAKKTRESIVLCEAAGFDTIIVETVGVGQSETAVKSMVDFFLLLMLAGAGDELQGIKRGIMEMADSIAITKSDGSNITRTGLAKSQIESALELYPPTPSGWVPRAQTCSSLTKEGLTDIHRTISDYFEFIKQNGFFNKNRKDQSLYWMYESIDHQLTLGFYNEPAIKHELEKIRADVTLGRMSSFNAARKLLEKYFHKDR